MEKFLVEIRIEINQIYEVNALHELHARDIYKEGKRVQDIQDKIIIATKINETFPVSQSLSQACPS